jgi:hypothetical protein
MSDAPELPKLIFAEITYRNLAGIGGDWFTMKTDEEKIPYIRKNLHDAALALIAKLEAERDAAHAEGYRAGVEAAAAKCEYGRKNYQILNKDKITPAPFTTQKAARTMAALLEEDIRALLNSEAAP